MAKITTAERVSREQSDNYVFQRSLLAYCKAAEIIEGNVLEIGTGEGYGAEILAPHATRFITIDKTTPTNLYQEANVEFIEAAVPPIPAENNSFDYVVSFQVIEHIKRDFDFVREVHRVLKPGGKFIVTTPNAPMSLTRNPWHVREYRAEELTNMLECSFSQVESFGVFGNEKIVEYYEKNRRSVQKITRLDVLRLQYLLPRFMLKLPYDLLNRINRRFLLKKNRELTTSISMDDYSVAPVAPECFDLFYIATK